MTDIPLPEPVMWYARGNVFSLEAIMQQGWHLETTGLFDADQMRAYAADCVAAERERCLVVIDQLRTAALIDNWHTFDALIREARRDA